MMWFHFKVSNLPLEPLDVVIENAGECSYVEGWANYRAVYSTDRLNWERLGATSYDEASGELRMTIDRNNDLAGASFVWLAYFAPYSYEDYMTFVGACAQSDRCSVETIGATLDGADMEVLTVRAAGSDASEDASKRSIWLIARQHPGESQASWWMEGCLARLLDEADPLSAKLLEGATFRVVANMNPDGSRRGHLRTNAAGANLNREWAKPSEVYSPEVFHVLREMQQSGLDFCLDVHGDEALPYNFIAGAEGIPSWTTRLASLQKEFCIAYERANPDFQLVEGYDVDAPGEANMLVCSNALTERFDAPALTLEMPFKVGHNTQKTYQRVGVYKYLCADGRAHPSRITPTRRTRRSVGRPTAAGG